MVDARDAWGEEGRIAGVRCVTGDFDEVGREVDPRGVCLVMTHDHALDQRAIEWALRRGFAFVGGVGSRAKAERTRQRLEAKGFSESDCAAGTDAARRRHRRAHAGRDRGRGRGRDDRVAEATAMNEA